MMIFSIVFITAGSLMRHYAMDSTLYGVFHELLYIPIVFFLPVFRAVFLVFCLMAKKKTFATYLSTGLCIAVYALFALKMYYAVYEQTLLF